MTLLCTFKEGKFLDLPPLTDVEPGGTSILVFLSDMRGSELEPVDHGGEGGNRGGCFHLQGRGR